MTVNNHVHFLRTKRAGSALIVPAVFFVLAVAYLVYGDLILHALDQP